ncbi:MAG: hypothetical protein U0269_23410 [Polyangiales bacterium]
MITEDGGEWRWERTSGEALREAVMRGDDLRPRPRAVAQEPVASVHSADGARRARQRR